jgi:hypothetical protein
MRTSSGATVHIAARAPAFNPGRATAYYPQV